MNKIKIHFDMETQDPDDVMTLAILATHPLVELIGVTITPGGPDQVGLVDYVLDFLGINVPIGGDKNREKPAVSAFHDKWLGKHFKIPEYTVDEILKESSRQKATLLTGAPLKNFKNIYEFEFPVWVAQGGFAGDSVVPKEYRLAKFDGMETCATFNFGGAPEIAKSMLESDKIKNKYLVSKNVCHGIAWNPEFHEKIKGYRNKTVGLELVISGMELYLQNKPEGKLLHDPLAMTVAIDSSVCEFKNVDVYREKGKWGSRLNENSNIKISIKANLDKFIKTLSICEFRARV